MKIIKAISYFATEQLHLLQIVLSLLRIVRLRTCIEQ